jgi:parallel beta-helix repeat protein
MADTIRVTNATELMQALAAAQGGETIVLAAGNYGDVVLRSTAQTNLEFGTPVTIISADPDDPAVFSGMDVYGAKNLTIDAVVFDYTFATGDKIFDRPFHFATCENLTVRNSRIDGDVAKGISEVEDGFAFGMGVVVRDSAGVTFENNEISNFWRGLTVQNCHDILVRGNDVHSMRSDGMNFIDVQRITIEENHIHDFRGMDNWIDHRDFIQFWTNGTSQASTDIVIRGNILDIGEGDFTQSIFMRNEEVDLGRAGAEMFYRNVLIEGNVIINGHSHGITVGETAGLTIRNNTVLHDDGSRPDGVDGTVEIPRINVATTSTGVVITQNLTSGISGYTNQPTWNISDNGIVQDQNPTAPGYYGDVFIASSMQQHAFILLPGSVFDEAGIGAPASQPENDLALVRFHVNGVEGDGASRVFDARFGAPEGTTFRWTFGDGSTAEGPLLKHSFTGGGVYDVILTVTLPDGTEAAATFTVAVAGPDVLRLSAGGDFVAYDNGRIVADMQGGTTEGLQLGATGTTATVGRQHVVDIVQTDEVAIDLTLKADATGAAGEVFRIHGSLIATVTAAGELSVAATGGDGRGVTVVTQGANLGDMGAHDIAIRLEGGLLTVSVDGEPAASAAVTLPLNWTGSHDLTFGNPWGSPNFRGDLTAFSIRTDMSDYPATPVTVPVSDNGEPPQGGRVLLGGSGDDVYIISYLTDIVDDAGGQDVAQSTEISLDLRRTAFEDVEHAALTGHAALDATGDGRDNRLIGNDGANQLTGNDGADSLTGGAGIDTLAGGAGNDAYRADGTDIIVEAADGGTDTVFSDGDVTLGENLEHLVLTGTTAADGTGNGADNRLSGNGAANTLRGAGGADTMIGGAGDDIYITDGDDTIIDSGGSSDMVRSSADAVLADGIELLVLSGTGDLSGDGNDLDNRITGNAGNNLLRGGNGTDTLAGGAGDDAYVVNAWDTVIEEAGGGIDTVRTGGSLTLVAAVEHLILTGSADAEATGNGLANRLIGNDGANRLDGGTGIDTLDGGAGNDTYVFRSGDILTEATGAGWDRVESAIAARLGANFEALVLTGSASVQGVGNGLGNWMVGNDGANRLVGMQGNDTLTGGAGTDTFIFRTGDGDDRVTDFDAVGTVHDLLHLRSVKAITGFNDLMENHARQWEAGVMITAGNDRILLEDVRLADLDRGDFVF